jgi:PAS domain S-box-containing protein
MSEDRGIAEGSNPTAPAHEEPGIGPAVLAEALARCPDAVVFLDAEARVRYWNRGAERIFGYRSQDMIGSTLERIVPERLRERHAAGFAAAVARGSSRYGDDDLLAVPALTADGDTISIEFTVTLLADAGKIASVAAVIRDVTERRKLERDLRRRLEAVESAVNAPGAGGA